MQVVFWTTWTIVLSSKPKSLSWLAFHPTLNTLALVCWVFGTSPNTSTRSSPHTLLTYIRVAQAFSPFNRRPSQRRRPLDSRAIRSLCCRDYYRSSWAPWRYWLTSLRITYPTSHPGTVYVRPFLPHVATLTRSLFLDLWPDHFYLAHCPGHGWCRKRLVWWGRLRGRSESQASVEVSQAIGLHSIEFTPHYHLPRWSVTIGLVPQLLRRSAYCLHSGAHFHPRIPLFSRQVRQIFSHMTT